MQYGEMESVQAAGTAASAPHRNAVRVVLILGARAPVCFVVLYLRLTRTGRLLLLLLLLSHHVLVPLWGAQGHLVYEFHGGVEGAALRDVQVEPCTTQIHLLRAWQHTFKAFL